ncbi:MAG: hypothetical protein DI640_02840 [Sphingomonas taxi]|uniref:Uncharacterized protein n=1 Tax=Sphingomonas taxi TaxID=1549858 RepID=A0A2W5AZK1_9SPHN|nr:MAG: hypothetical protein DI640_02840 [Sphingomonas taxi]
MTEGAKSVRVTTATPAKAGAQLGDVSNEAQSFVTATFPIVSRPSPGWCLWVMRVVNVIEDGRPLLVLPRRREPSLDPRLRGETILLVWRAFHPQPIKQVTLSTLFRTPAFQLTYFWYILVV